MNKHFTVLLLAALFATLVPAAAEESGSREAELEQRYAEVRERLELTDEQAARIEPIIASGAEATRRVLEENGIDPEARAASGKRSRLSLRKKRAIAQDLRKIQADVLDDMSEILTEEQLAEYAKMQEERRSKMREQITG